MVLDISNRDLGITQWRRLVYGTLGYKAYKNWLDTGPVPSGEAAAPRHRCRCGLEDLPPRAVPHPDRHAGPVGHHLQRLLGTAGRVGQTAWPMIVFFLVVITPWCLFLQGVLYCKLIDGGLFPQRLLYRLLAPAARFFTHTNPFWLYALMATPAVGRSLPGRCQHHRSIPVHEILVPGYAGVTSLERTTEPTMTATKLKNFDWEKSSELTTSEKAVYPWEEWLDGDIWQLTYGEDFQTHPLMMERIIRTRATGRRAKVRLRHVPMNGEPWGIIVLQRTDVPGPAEQRKPDSAAKRKAKKADADKEAAKFVKDLPKANGRVAKKATPTPTKKPARKLAAVG